MQRNICVLVYVAIHNMLIHCAIPNGVGGVYEEIFQIMRHRCHAKSVKKDQSFVHPESERLTVELSGEPGDVRRITARKPPIAILERNFGRVGPIRLAMIGVFSSNGDLGSTVLEAVDSAKFKK